MHGQPRVFNASLNIKLLHVFLTIFSTQLFPVLNPDQLVTAALLPNFELRTKPVSGSFALCDFNTWKRKEHAQAAVGTLTLTLPGLPRTPNQARGDPPGTPQGSLLRILPALPSKSSAHWLRAQAASRTARPMAPPPQRRAPPQGLGLRGRAWGGLWPSKLAVPAAEARGAEG